VPLDDLQKAVLKVLLTSRTPDSVFAGGSVLQRHAFRLSDDQDIFHPEDKDVSAIAANDMELLRAHGFTAKTERSFEGQHDAIVGNEEMGFTKIQWVQAGSWTFFEPVPDLEYGWRLHMADLAVNKVLAAGGRKQVRDYVDLALIHNHIMPLWHALWAAPGKDESWSPGSLAEKIAMTSNFKQLDYDSVTSTIPLLASDIGGTIRQAIEEAREVFNILPKGTAGRLFIDGDGQIVRDPAVIVKGEGVTPLEVKRGGTWPSGPDIDHVLISRIAEKYGRDDGAKLEEEGGSPPPP